MHPDATIREAVALGDAGFSATEIAGLTGVSRRTISDWLNGRTPRRRAVPDGRCSGCGGGPHQFEALPQPYVYLLGMYLGDGCLSRHPRGVYKLRIVLDLAYPGLIEECEDAIQAVMPANRVRRASKAGRCLEVYSYSKSWPCLFPQHGPGRKHERRIWLAGWQEALVERRPDLLLRGLLHSDGHRFVNTGRAGWTCPRYGFTNASDDIRSIFCTACEALGLRWTRSGERTVYVSRMSDVELLDLFVGPKR